MLHIRKLLLVAGISLMATTAQAQKATGADFAQLMATYDLDRNGILSPRELELLNRDIRIAREREARKRGVAPPTPGVIAPASPRPDNIFSGVLLLRDQYSAVPFINDSEKLSSNGATFSWTNDRVAHQTTVQGSGALFYAFQGELGLNTPDNGLSTTRLTRVALLPGVEWDVTSRNAKNEGVVSARAGAEFELSGGLFPTQYVRGSAIYTTDISTSSAEVVGTEWSFIPIAPLLRIGARTALSEKWGLWLGLFPAWNAEYSHVGNNGTLGSLIPNHDYLWTGPTMNAELVFLSGPFDGFGVSAKYFYLYDVLGGSATSVNYLEAATRYKFGNWDLGGGLPANRADVSGVFKYTVGTTPHTLVHKNAFFAGLEVKLGDLGK